MKTSVIFLMSLVCLISSCSKIKELEYRGISDTKIKQAGFAKTSIQLNVKFYNPNSFGVDVKEADLDVFVDDRKMGKADFENQEGVYNIPQNKEFALPIVAHIDPMQALGSALQMLSKSKLNLMVKGTTKVGKGGVFIKVPINVSQEVDLKNIN